MRLGDRLLVLSLLDALGVGAAREVLTMVIATVYELRFMFAIGLGCLFNTALGAGRGHGKGKDWVSHRGSLRLAVAAAVVAVL